MPSAQRSIVALCLGILLLAGCGQRDALTADSIGQETIQLDQDVTTSGIVIDAEFANFEKDWRRFVAEEVEFTLPVLRPERYPPADEQEPEPLVIGECVYSAEAGGLVPQVTVIWTDNARRGTDQGRYDPEGSAGKEKKGEGQGERDLGSLRFDVALQHDGFNRNYYTTALASSQAARFRLPSNSAFVTDEEAVLLTGPGIFPKLMKYQVQAVAAPESGLTLDRNTLILGDLSPGLTYTVRSCVKSGEEWVEQRDFLFLTPVCPNSF